METVISLYLGWGAKLIILLDSDEMGIKQKKRYEELFGLSISDKIITYLNIDNSWINRESETLFSKSEQMEIQKKCYPTEEKYSKKLFNRSIQECYINRTKFELSTDTIENFKKVIDYLQVKLQIN